MEYSEAKFKKWLTDNCSTVHPSMGYRQARDRFEKALGINLQLLHTTDDMRRYSYTRQHYQEYKASFQVKARFAEILFFAILAHDAKTYSAIKRNRALYRNFLFIPRFELSSRGVRPKDLHRIYDMLHDNNRDFLIQLLRDL